MVETTSDLPAMPQIWLKIRDMTQQLNNSAPKIAKEILKDQGMTTRVLKIANSATYAGYNQKITTVTNAIVLLGFNEVRNVVVGYAVYEMLKKLKKNKRFNFKEFWLHALATAVASRMLADNVQYKNVEEAFVAGLLHDVGKLVISQLMPNDYDKVLLRNLRGEENLEAEEEILHVNHQIIGKWVAKRWHLPEVLVLAISKHHRVDMEKRQKSRYRIIDIVSVANEMAHLIFSRESTNRNKTAMDCQANALSLLSISKERWSHIVRNLAANVRKQISEYNLNESDIDSLLRTLEDEGSDKGENEKLYQEMNLELQKTVQELSVLNDFSAALLEIDNATKVQELLLESIFRGVSFNRILFFSPDQEKNISVTAGYGAGVESVVGKASLNLTDAGVVVRSYLERQPFNVLNAESPLFKDQVSQGELDLLQCRAFACVPLVAGSKSIGVLVVDNHIAQEPVPDQRLGVVATFCNQASLVLKRLV